MVDRDVRRRVLLAAFGRRIDGESVPVDGERHVGVDFCNDDGGRFAFTVRRSESGREALAEDARRDGDSIFVDADVGVLRGEALRLGGRSVRRRDLGRVRAGRDGVERLDADGAGERQLLGRLDDVGDAPFAGRRAADVGVFLERRKNFAPGRRRDAEFADNRRRAGRAGVWTLATLRLVAKGRGTVCGNRCEYCDYLDYRGGRREERRVLVVADSGAFGRVRVPERRRVLGRLLRRRGDRARRRNAPGVDDRSRNAERRTRDGVGGAVLRRPAGSVPFLRVVHVRLYGDRDYFGASVPNLDGAARAQQRRRRRGWSGRRNDENERSSGRNGVKRRKIGGIVKREKAFVVGANAFFVGLRLSGAAF